MENEFLTRRQAICFLIIFVLGSTIVFGVTGELEQDAWIAVIGGVLIALVFSLVYARIMKIYPEKSLFGILEEVFGKILGKVLTVIFTWYAIHLGAAIMRTFTDYVSSTALPTTPPIVIMIVMLAVVLYLAKSGTETFGKWCVAAIMIIIPVFISVTLFSLKGMNFANLLPVFSHGLGKTLSVSYTQFSLPFGEIVLFLAAAGTVRKEDSPYRIYIYSILLVGLIALIVNLRNLAVLGPELVKESYYPSFTTAKIVNIGEFLARIESLISMNFMLAGLTKICFCVIAASMGTASLFNVKKYNVFMAPTTFTIIALSLNLYKNQMQLFEFVKEYQFYVIPFQIILPLIIWIAAEIKSRIKRIDQDKESA
ncbi:MAG: endospore germination permease [Bacillota bacterium]|nr:endospore germination permease [Bacillota bacterium]